MAAPEEVTSIRNLEEIAMGRLVQLIADRGRTTNLQVAADLHLRDRDAPATVIATEGGTFLMSVRRINHAAVIPTVREEIT